MTNEEFADWAALAEKAAGIRIDPDLIKLDDSEFQDAVDRIAEVERNRVPPPPLPPKTQFFFGRPKLGKILVLPLQAASQFTYDKPWAAISISSEGIEFPKIDVANLVGWLRLTFHDIDWIPKDSTRTPFNKHHAQYILDFVRTRWDSIDLLMVNCYAGQSRSAAVGKVLSEIYQDPEITKHFDSCGIFRPNTLVYETLKEVQKAG